MMDVTDVVFSPYFSFRRIAAAGAVIFSNIHNGNPRRTRGHLSSVLVLQPRLPPSYDEVELAGRLDSVSLGNPRGSDPGKDVVGSHHMVLPSRLQQG
jgi:hypothetical protein